MFHSSLRRNDHSVNFILHLYMSGSRHEASREIPPFASFGTIYYSDRDRYREAEVPGDSSLRRNDHSVNFILHLYMSGSRHEASREIPPKRHQ